MDALAMLPSCTFCVACGKADPAFVCGTCRTVYYCSAACQEMHFPQHTQECVDIHKKVAAEITLIDGIDLEQHFDKLMHYIQNEKSSPVSCVFHREQDDTSNMIFLDCGHFACFECCTFGDHAVCAECQSPLPSERWDKWIYERSLLLRDYAWNQGLPRRLKECCTALALLILRPVVKYFNDTNYMHGFLHSSGATVLYDNNYISEIFLMYLAICIRDPSIVNGGSSELRQIIENMKVQWTGNRRAWGRYYSALLFAETGDMTAGLREMQTLTNLIKHESSNADERIESELKAGVVSAMPDFFNTGFAARHIRGTLKASRDVRMYPGIHRPLAKWQLGQGQIKNALHSLATAMAHEAPWNVVNRQENIQSFYAIKEDLELKQTQKEELRVFRETWGDVADLCQRIDFSKGPVTWSDWREAFTIEGGMDSDDEDEEARLQQTGELLTDAMQKALVTQDYHDSFETGDVEVPSLAWTKSNENDAPSPQVLVDKEAVEYVDSVNRVMLTNDILKWLKNADSRFRGLFVKKVERLMRGERSHKLSKGLEGCQSKIFETYLENKSGHRILWTQQPGTGILIWYVSAHKKVSRYAGLIDNSEKRSARPYTTASDALGHGALDENSLYFETGTVLLDPKHHVPLRLYEVPTDDIKRLESNTGWRPSLHLTPREEEIVKTQGTVCVLGRSGTGKTVTISNRIHFDRHVAGTNPNFSQLFIARSKKVCNYVKETVGDDDVSSTLLYWTYEKFLSQTEHALGLQPMTDSRRNKRMDFGRFKAEFYNAGSMKIDPLVVWTQIRSFIKGSIQSVKCGRSLTRDEYLALGERQNRLSSNLRNISYNVFESYNKMMKENKFWDDTDRVSAIVVKLCQDQDLRLGIRKSRVYVDEVQDFTQAEIAMFFQCCDPGRLFLAGDPAQAVEEGVAFRFEDVRIVAHQMVRKKTFRPDKPKLLRVNFRSHTGVLNLAAGILDLLFQAFPGSAKELPKDEGLFRGPRPTVFRALGEEELRELVEKQAGAVLLSMAESTVQSLQNKFGETVTVLSIRESKGLEFDHVILVNFFSDLQHRHQKSWKDMINGNNVSNPELELQLKQLYTAITRCCKRFLFAESKTSIALDAFLKWATHRRSKQDKTNWLIEEQNINAAEDTVMTRDEWVARGLLFASKAEEEEDLDEQEKWLTRSLAPFTFGGSEADKKRVKTHLESVRLRKNLAKVDEGSGLSSAETSEREVSALISDLADERIGLAVEAAKLCRDLIRVVDDNGEAEKILVQTHVLAHLPVPEEK